MAALTTSLADYVSTTKFESLPPEVVEKCTFLLADTVAVALAGHKAPGVREVRAVALQEKGVSHAAIWGYGDWVPAREASLVNGTMAHALDFDANHDVVDYKACVATIPAAIATAQFMKNQGRTLSGRDFLTAVYTGIELGSRIAVGINPKPCHAFARTVGCFASTISAAKVLGLSPAKIGNALGIAFAETGLGGVTTESPALTKRLGAGIASRAGVWAAFLAEKGFTGQIEIFSGPNGFYQVYFKEEEDAELVVGELGKSFQTFSIAVKPYPCCRYTHSAIDCALTLKEKEGLPLQEIVKITAWVNERDFEIIGGGGIEEHIRILRNPRGVVDAQFSLPYTIALALVIGKPRIRDFKEEALRRPDVLDVANKVEVKLDPVYGKNLGEKRVKIEIETKQGTTLKAAVEAPRPADEEEFLVEKMHDCLIESGLFDDSQLDGLIDVWLHIDELTDVEEAFACLSMETAS